MKPVNDEHLREPVPAVQPDEITNDELDEVAGGVKTYTLVNPKLKLPPYVYVTRPKLPIPDPEPGW